jgi:uncharacterized protein with ACT and thioredoxin-like domain
MTVLQEMGYTMGLQVTDELSQVGSRHHPSVQAALPFFGYEHLQEPQKAISRIFHDAAVLLLEKNVTGPQLTIALNKLTEAKDAAVRASL